MNCLLRSIAVVCLLQTAGVAQTGRFDWSAAPGFDPGIRYAHLTLTDPRNMDLHAMQIDTREPHIQFYTTPPHAEWIGNLHETRRATTRDFLREARAAGLNMIVAINADAFEPWPAPYAQRTLTNLRGLAVSAGMMVSPPSDSPSFLVYEDGRTAIVASVASLDRIRLAISGFAIVLEDGVPSGGDERIAPRTGIGVSADARFVCFLAIDGRRHLSEGATTEEVGRWLLYFGAHNGINLDGGGSTSMVRHDPSAPGDGVVVLNSPVGDGTDWRKFGPAVEREKYKPSERANGNNIGVYLTRE